MKEINHSIIPEARSFAFLIFNYVFVHVISLYACVWFMELRELKLCNCEMG